MSNEITRVGRNGSGRDLARWQGQAHEQVTLHARALVHLLDSLGGWPGLREHEHLLHAAHHELEAQVWSLANAVHEQDRANLVSQYFPNCRCHEGDHDG